MSAQAEGGNPGSAIASREAGERALLQRIAGGDSQALRELYFAYHRRLARYLMRLAPRYELAEEVINDTFWVVWQGAAGFRGDSQVSTWIFGIAYRRALKSLRRAGPRPAEDEPETEPSVDPEQAVELSEWLAVALERLPAEQRMVLELAYHVGHSCEEVASIMGCPVNTVKTRMFHARRKLRLLLTSLSGVA